MFKLIGLPCMQLTCMCICLSLKRKSPSCNRYRFFSIFLQSDATRHISNLCQHHQIQVSLYYFSFKKSLFCHSLVQSNYLRRLTILIQCRNPFNLIILDFESFFAGLIAYKQWPGYSLRVFSAQECSSNL